MKFKTIIFLISLIPLSLWADFENAPHNFQTADGKVVFLDFKNAEYNISYDAKTKTVNAVSSITFESFEAGLPAFDLVNEPKEVVLDGELVTSKIISAPERETNFRIALKTIQPGLHTFVITSPITEGVSFTAEGVSSAFWFDDLNDRSFLEAYVPANFEYDQFKITFNLDFKTLNKQKIYTNGVVTNLDHNKYRVEFPATYTSSSLYFHTAPIGRYNEINFVLHSVDGRNIPVTAYAANKATSLESVKTKIQKSISTLESKYGPFLHNTLTVFIAGSGGMEYCGATMTDVGAMNHELTHSYFARGGLMPANGNSGWLDEAITSWSDESRPDIPEMNARANMAGNSEYRRYTHGNAYSTGRDFMAHLNYKFQGSGGLNSFLNHLIKTDAFKTLTTEKFVSQMSEYYSEDVMPLFKKHVYSNRSAGQAEETEGYHKKMTIKEMREFL